MNRRQTVIKMDSLHAWLYNSYTIYVHVLNFDISVRSTFRDSTFRISPPPPSCSQAIEKVQGSCPPQNVNFTRGVFCGPPQRSASLLLTQNL